MLREYFNNNWQVAKGADWFTAVKDNSIKTVNLPHDAMILEKRNENNRNKNNTGFFPGGVYTYTKKFMVEEELKNKTVYFEFEGIQTNGMVYINGDFTGKCPNGYMNFYVKANRFLKYGEENEIRVVAKTSSEQNTRWYTGSGIYRNVKLIVGDRIHIKLDGVRATTPNISDDEAVIEIETTVENESFENKSGHILTEIYDNCGDIVAKDLAPITFFMDEEISIKQRILLENPRLWDTENPNLYTCKTKVIIEDKTIDEDINNFGIRELKLDVKNGLRINGKTVKLRGACVHHDNGVIGACTFEDAEERRVRILKEAGFNAIRSAHNPMSKAMLDACDRLGMLVMEETFDMWNIPKSDYDYGLFFNEWWERDLESIVNKDFNHPSVIIYSLGNEIVEAGTKNGANINLKIAKKLRSLDNTRFTINSVNGMFTIMGRLGEIIGSIEKERNKTVEEKPIEEKEKEINNMMSKLADYMDDIVSHKDVTKATEQMFAGVDIAGYNYMTGRYAKDGKLFPNRVICGSEAAPRNIDINWKYVKEKSNIIGDFTWVGWDYLGEAGVGKHDYTMTQNCGIYGPYPWYIAYCGDIDITGNRRPASYYKEVVWGLRKEPYIAIQRPEHYNQPALATQWSWSDSISSWAWKGYESKPIKVEIYSDSEEVELVLNGKSLGKMETGEKNRFKAIFETIYEPGILEAVAYTGGQETGKTKLVTAGEIADIKVDVEKIELRSNGRDLAYLNISLVDKDGNINMNEAKKVSIEVDGQGTLQGFGSADPKSLENFYDKERTTYDGKLLAVIRAGEIIGKVKVILKAENIEKIIEIKVI